MMHRVADCVRRWIGTDVEASETVNTHHNYTAQETHFGQEVWLSRTRDLVEIRHTLRQIVNVKGD